MLIRGKYSSVNIGFAVLFEVRGVNYTCGCVKKKHEQQFKIPEPNESKLLFSYFNNLLEARVLVYCALNTL